MRIVDTNVGSKRKKDLNTRRSNSPVPLHGDLCNFPLRREVAPNWISKLVHLYQSIIIILITSYCASKLSTTFTKGSKPATHRKIKKKKYHVKCRIRPNPLIPINDQHVTSPCNIRTLSGKQITRIPKLIRKKVDLTPNSRGGESTVAS